MLPGKKDRKIAPPQEEDKIVIAYNKKLLSTLPPPDLVLTSTWKRTIETAQQYGFIDAQEEPLLDELDFGPYAGEPRQDFLEEVGVQWFINPKRTLIGPAVEVLEERVLSFLEKYSTYDCLLIFGQPFFSQALISYIRHGHIIGMNILSVKYNELIHLKVKKEDHEEDEKN